MNSCKSFSSSQRNRGTQATALQHQKLFVGIEPPGTVVYRSRGIQIELSPRKTNCVKNIY